MLSKPQSSNGPVTAVKTWQLASLRASTSSAPSQELAPSSLDDYTVLSSSTAAGAPATAQQLASLTAIPAAMLVAARKANRGKGKKNGGVDRTLGNDQSPPWFKHVSNRASFRIVGETEPALLATSSTTVPVFSSIQFIVSALDNFTNLAAVFDQYRIDMIECWILPQLTEVVAPSGGSSFYITTVDVDDAATPTSFAQLTGYPNAQVSNGTMTHYHRWRPQFAVAAYSGAFTSYSSSTGWLDCGSPGVNYYGLKFASQTASVVQNYTYITRLHCSFRALH